MTNPCEGNKRVDSTYRARRTLNLAYPVGEINLGVPDKRSSVFREIADGYCEGEDLAAIRCQIVAHRKQRYDTVGDYWRTPARVWLFRISRMKDRRYVWLVFLHELIEWAICRLQRISMRAIDAFDMRYEKSRRSGAGKPPCGCPFGEEPGEDVHAPYHDAHMVATQCERLIARALNVDWLDYAEAIEALHART